MREKLKSKAILSRTSEMATNATTHEPTVKDINDEAKKELI
jgi:hypothetical protein